MRITVAAIAIGLSFQLQGQVSDAQRIPESNVVAKCRMSQLVGAYIYAQDGFTVAGTEATSRTPFAQSGREYYDGKGSVTGIYTASINGKIVRGSYAGTYTMGLDCFGEVTFTDNLGQTYHYDIFMTDGGDEFSFIQTDPGIVSASFERRRPAITR